MVTPTGKVEPSLSGGVERMLTNRKEFAHNVRVNRLPRLIGREKPECYLGVQNRLSFDFD